MFGRRRRVDYAQRGTVGVAHLYPNAHRPGFGTTGWKPFAPMATPNMQTGAYDGTMLTQYPSMLPGVQLNCGVEGLRSNWYVPPGRGYGLPLGSVQLTQRGGNVTPVQLNGQTYKGNQAGPIASRTMAASVVAQQVRQSGTQAMQWARGLAGAPVSGVPQGSED